MEFSPLITLLPVLLSLPVQFSHFRTDMNPSIDMPSVLTSLTMNDISTALPSHALSRAKKQSCTKMEDAMYQLPKEQQQLLAHAASAKKHRITTDMDDELFL